VTSPPVTDALRADVQILKRGAMASFAGYALKLGMPVLLALATRSYGADGWGRFASAQAYVLLAARFCLFGLDKSLLRFVPQAGASAVYQALGPAALRSGGAACAVACLAWVVAPLLPTGPGTTEIAAVAALGLPPLVLSELLLHATMGLGRMELQVLVRDTVTPLLQVALALAFAQANFSNLGLAAAYALAQYAGLCVAWVGFRRLFAEAPRLPQRAALPAGMLEYALPMWGAELANALLLRLDTLVLTALAEPALVGVWAVVMQFGGALRQIRRAYDPMIMAIAARLQREPHPPHLAGVLGHATYIIALTQLPMLAAVALLSDVILPLYGPGFERGAPALLVLAGSFVLSGGAGLAGVVVSAYGHARLALLNVLVTLVLEGLLLPPLIERLGLTGAAAAVGVAVCATNLLQLAELRAVTGSLHVGPEARRALRLTATCCAALLLGDRLGCLLDLPPAGKRGLTASCFAVAYCALGARALWQSRARATLPQELSGARVQ
jgi:O-antigen/teichoic acid export membrane protein